MEDHPSAVLVDIFFSVQQLDVYVTTLHLTVSLLSSLEEKGNTEEKQKQIAFCEAETLFITRTVHYCTPSCFWGGFMRYLVKSNKSRIQ